MTEPYLNTVMSWLVARARTIERETVEAGRPLSIGLAQGLALMHAPDEPDLERLMTARMRSNDSTDVINDLQLRTDLARLKTGWRPDEHDLAEAPHLRVGGILDPVRSPVVGQPRRRGARRERQPDGRQSSPVS